MIVYRQRQSNRIAWIEGVRFFAVVMILLYHAQLLFTNYAFTPQPAGLWDNLQKIIIPLNDRTPDLPIFINVLSLPIWFGFQFVDVFVLISGFSLVLSLKGKPLESLSFLKQRFLRLMWPFWTVAWLSYPILLAVGTATNNYIPPSWSSFGSATFPLLFDFRGEILQLVSGPWWFVSLIISFTLMFPFLWRLLQRWGAGNLLLVSTLLTISYRALATYQLGGHPSYVIIDTSSGEQPFISFLAKLSTFVIGMIVAQAYEQGKGPMFWSQKRSLLWGIFLYVLGFICQFYRLGWVFADLLLPLGLMLLCMVFFRSIARNRSIKALMVLLGSYSYSYFLIHNFVVDRVINLVIQDSIWLYYLLLPLMIVGTLILAILADHTRPLLEKSITKLLEEIDYVLTQTQVKKRRIWTPAVGDKVWYQASNDWTVIKIEKLLDEQDTYLCKIARGDKTLWVSESNLQLSYFNPIATIKIIAGSPT